MHALVIDGHLEAPCAQHSNSSSTTTAVGLRGAVAARSQSVCEGALTPHCGHSRALKSRR